MNVKKSLITTSVITSFLSSQLVGSSALAQFDDFPPPPPAISDEPSMPSANGAEVQPSFNDSNSNSATKISPTGKGATSGVLSTKQKEKFAKASPEDITPENFPETIESFDFPNADITDIIKAISELTGKNFIIDSTVKGKITILAPSKITVAEAYKAFLSSLALNGFTIVPSGGFLKIRSARAAQRDGIDIFSGAYYPNADQMITKVVHLKHISAEQLKQQIGRLLTSTYGEIEPYPQTNSLIISDFGSSIDRIMKIINQLDVPGFEEQLEVVGIKYARAKDIAELIDKIVNKGQKSSSTNAGGFNSGVPRFNTSSSSSSASKSSGAASFMVFPDDRTNSLIIVGNRPGIARVKRLISQLDYKMTTDNQGGVYVYYVKYGNAEDIAKTLSEVAKDSAPKQSQTQNTGFGFAPIGQAAIREGVFGGDVQIKADKNTNSIVVSASKQDYDKVMSILDKLDIPRDQVYIEAIIMELALNNGDTKSGGLVKFNKDGGKTGFAGKAEDLTDILNPLSGAGSAILGFASGSVEVPSNILNSTSTEKIKVPSLLGFLKFVKQFGKTNILSRPSLIATDAQPATIEVGDKVVVRTVFTPGTNGSPGQATPEFDNASIKMEIKPYISPATDSIRMEFKQTVKQLSTVAVPANLNGTLTPLAERSINTNVILRSGDTAVIGGLMKDEDKEDVIKVPILGDIPILGWFFKRKEVSKRKVNMLVFLSPKILRTPKDKQDLLTEKTSERLQFLKDNGGKDPNGRVIDKILKREARIPQSTTKD